MTTEEITKEILITMIQQGKINIISGTKTEDFNKAYTDEVCKAFITVFKTVNNAAQSIYETK